MASSRMRSFRLQPQLWASRRTSQRTTTALVTTNSAEATGEALRSLRRSDRRILGVGKDDAWRLFEVPTRTFQARRTWRLTTPRAEAALSKFLDAGAARISDLFDVRQGVHTGNNRAFVLGKSDYETLPKTERRFFIPAVMNQSIQDGQLRLLYWVFYPYDLRGQMFKTEDELMAAVPTYAERFLIPHREDLLARRSRARGGYTDWWGLSERRATWAFDSTPRLVSKYRGGPGGRSGSRRSRRRSSRRRALRQRIRSPSRAAGSDTANASAAHRRW